MGHPAVVVVRRVSLVENVALADGVCCEGDGYEIIWSFDGAAVALGMEFDTHGLGVDDDTEVAVVGGVVVFESKCVVDLVGCAIGSTH